MEREILGWISLAIGVAGLAVILWGVVLGVWRFLSSEYLRLRGDDETERRLALRHELGFYILLGLEFLVAADIVHTILHPSLHELAILATIVGIRTVISLSLNWELSHAARRRREQGA